MAPGRVCSMSLRGVYCGLLLAGEATEALPNGDLGVGGSGEWTDAKVVTGFGAAAEEEEDGSGALNEDNGAAGGGVTLRRGGGGVPLALLRPFPRRSDNFGDGGGVDLMNGATCGVGVVNVLILTGVACGLCDGGGGGGGEAFLAAIAPLAGGGAAEEAALPAPGVMLSSCCSSRQILWMSLSMSRSVRSVAGSFLALIPPPPLLCRSRDGFRVGGGALK